MSFGTASPRNDYTGNNSTASYSYGFRIFDPTDLKVIQVDLMGNRIILVLNVDYSVANVGNPNGGTITLLAGNLPTGYGLTIRMWRTPQQQANFRNQKTYFPEVIEDKFDELVRFIQQNADDLSRALKLPETEIGAPASTTISAVAARANQFLAFDAQGNLIMAAGTSANLGPVSNYINTLLPAADAKTARQTLLLDGQSSDLASAASINLDTTTGDLLDLTGNASVSTITLAQGVEKTLRVTGTPTFVNGSNLLLPGGVNIVGASGDIVVFRGYASGVVRCVQYQRNSGFPLATLGGGLGTATPNGVPTLIGIPRNYKSGFIQSTAGASATMTIGAGQVTDSTNAQVLTLAAALNKTTASWAVGSNQGGLDTGTIAATTPYHFFAILRPDTGVVDVVFSLSLTPALPANYTYARRIGWGVTDGSGQWVKFYQDGHRYFWDQEVNDLTVTNPGTTAQAPTLTLPSGINVEALLNVILSNSGGAGQAFLYLSDLATLDQVCSVALFHLGPAQTAANSISNSAGQFTIRTNTAKQIRYRLNLSNASITVTINTIGWIDYFGENG